MSGLIVIQATFQVGDGELTDLMLITVMNEEPEVILPEII
jgi:hypothetical protein